METKTKTETDAYITKYVLVSGFGILAIETITLNNQVLLVYSYSTVSFGILDLAKTYFWFGLAGRWALARDTTV